MVKRSLSPRDFELLSSYLDHQLSEVEQQRLELRLRQEPELDEALQGLRRTRSMLRSLPRRRAPRNFTLSPAMVGAKPVTSPRPVFGIFSALAAVLLIFVLLSDVLLVPGYVGMFPVSLGSPQAQSADQAVEMEVAQENQADELLFPTDIPLVETAPLEQPALEQPAMKAIPEDAGGETLPPSEEITTLEQAGSEPSPDSATALDTARSAPEAADEALSSAMEITATVEITAAQIMTSTLEVQAVPTEAVVAVAPEFPMEDTGVIEREGGAETLEQAPAPVGLVQADRSLMWVQLMFWMVELFLAVLAVGSAGVAVFMWLKSRQ